MGGERRGRGGRLPINVRRADGSRSDRGRNGIERGVPVGPAQYERHLDGHAGEVVPGPVLHQQPPLQCPAKTACGAGALLVQAAATSSPGEPLKQLTGGRGRIGHHRGDPLRIAVVTHEGGEALLPGVAG